ncbi:MAG: hypothetical protein ACR2OY_12905 [Boseongicola sp.]
MIFRILACASLGLIAACAQPIPDSNPNPGVGFDGYDAYAIERKRRDAELQAMRQTPVPEGQVIATETMTALAVDRPIAGTAPVTNGNASNTQSTAGTSPVQTAAVLPADNPNISDEQDFTAVSDRESIESDAERLARNRDQFEVIQPGVLPVRSGSDRPNIVAYALATTHPLGTSMHRRSGRTNIDRFNRVCAAYGSNDQAQEAFLSNGGPDRDRKGMDPDGDGFACYWDPTPFRRARGG